MFSKNYIAKKPFPGYKWKWASVQCTEGINDPVVLLGVLFRMAKLEPMGVKYSSPEFAYEMTELTNDIKESIGVNLAGRTGERNIIRNSSQYWKAVGLIPLDSRGNIELTDFGRKVANHDISQAEFSAITIQTFRLPNRATMGDDEYNEWKNRGLYIYPLRLLLQIIVELNKIDKELGYITVDELTNIIIPLAGNKAELQDYINFILWYRAGEISLIGWDDCCPRANDKRIAREFLLFLSNYGYINYIDTGVVRDKQKFMVNYAIIDEIEEIISIKETNDSVNVALQHIRDSEVVSEVERKRIQVSKQTRPNQANFRKQVLTACKRCVISNVMMPEILEAAHIKPYKYKGADTVANGFAMRTDIHTLFDTGHLRISVDGDVELSSKARMDYGASIPPRIVIPSFIDIENLRWRWDNYNGI